MKAASGLLVLLLFSAAPQPVPLEEDKSWWRTEVEQALARAGDNRPQLIKALHDVPTEQRKGLAFLVANMPDHDLRSLSAVFLLENVRLAYDARRQVPWGRDLPETLFLNDVLPYANVDEARDPWRKQLYELCLPLVKDCKTPGEAALVLNRTIFPKLKVRYSTARKQPHQSPKETIAQGKATCTGLSILLSDACRSVAVPARLAGTPLWSNGRGNHTWVEVWDHGWHFVGAAEPDPKGLDRAWFVGDAAQAKKTSRLNAIYAVSFRRTGLSFPLVWAPARRDVYAVNVTDRYTRSAKPALPEAQRRLIEKATRVFFAANPQEQARWHFDEAHDRLLLDHEAEVRRLVWEAYKAAPIHADLKKDFAQHQVRYQKFLSAYAVRKVGKRPENGWPLFIALHGGGGAPKAVNDSQWEIMKHYYRDQPSVPGYLYLALRAPNDTWNGFYDNYVPPLVTNLIHQFLLFGDVDPDKVYLMGYSHGGYGAFFIGPKIPDRFAAIHSSAAAPTDGTISPRSLRNTRFTFMVGERDNAYGRRQRCEKFAADIAKLKKKDPEGYPVQFELIKGFGHGGLPDRDKIKAMFPFTRNPVPQKLAWDLTDNVIHHFFWLAVSQPAAGMTLEAQVQDNVLRIHSKKIKSFDVYLDGRLVDFSRTIRVIWDGKELSRKRQPSLLTLCRTMQERGDPELAFTCRVFLDEKSR
jgi:predicted esterase